jgi:CDGSH-type Zn-finger protein
MSLNPTPVELEANKNYYWCTCGMSQNAPFCDGSHKGSGKKSHVFTPDETKTYYLCECKATKTPPYCDGSHSSI